jgi:hypothetical protein
VIVLGGLPENISGFQGLDQKSAVFASIKSELDFRQTNDIMLALTGKGRVIMGNDLQKLLDYAGIRRETMADSNISFMRRLNGNETIYFIKKQSKEPFTGWLPLNAQSLTAGLFNPMTGSLGLAARRESQEGKTEVYARILPGETFIVKLSGKTIQGTNYMLYDEVKQKMPVNGEWTLKFNQGWPVLPSERKLGDLISWTETGGEDVKNFSGTATYKTIFSKPSFRSDAYLIDLGKVACSARVILNGAEIATLIGPDFSVTVDKKLIKKTNILEVKVSNLMANRIAWMDKNKIEWKKFYNINFAARLRENNKNGIFDASEWKPMESGLMGPVTISALNLHKF